jgi:uncharacterized protein
MLIAILADRRISAKGITAALDAHGDRMIALFSLMTGLMITAFFAMALMLAPAHAADSPACTGENLAASITDQKALAEIEAKVAGTPNNKGIIWRISKPGLPDSYLFGTMHVTDPRVLTLPTAAQAAFDGASKLVIETTDVLDQAKASAALMKRPDLMMFTDGNALDTMIAKDDLPMVEAGLAARGMPLASVRLMKPWMLASLLATPACELSRKGKVEILDIDLARRAEKAGKAVEGLETMEEQISAMASLPLEDHVRGLVETVRLADRIDDVFETMIALYAQGETARLMPLLGVALADSGLREANAADEAAYAAFEEKMINTRNATMAERLPEHLAAGGAFVAVGALHLPGEKGLVEMLRKDGYTLAPVE